MIPAQCMAIAELVLEENGAYPPTIIATNWVGGRPVPSASGERLEARSAPDDRDVVARMPRSAEDDVRAACGAARTAFETWSRTPAPQRGLILGRFGRLLEDAKEALSAVLSREIGKPMQEARGEVQEAIDTAQFFQSEGRRLYGQTVPSEMRAKELFTYRRPLGVAGMITAANFPFAVPAWKIVPALLCGNTVVWKPSENAPGVAHLFAHLLERAGLPPGVLNVVHGLGHEAGQAILQAVDEGLIDKVSFTGSTEVGRKVGEVCGRNLQIPSLELGGKNPLVVLRDADLDLALEGVLFSGFGTGGQRCTSLGNLILDRPIRAEFQARLLKRLESLCIGNPTKSEDVFYGPLMAKRFFDRFMDHFALARSSGARLLTPVEGRITAENRPEKFVGDPDHGLYVFPAVWDQVRIEDPIAQTEVFGPTISIIEVDGLDDALRVANGTPYGLSSAIYTNDPHNILKFKSEIRAGMTSINNSTTGAEAHLPFGGVGWSGNGTRESGIWVIDAYSRWHAVNEDLAGRLQLAQIDVDFGGEIAPLDLSQLDRR